MDGTNNPQIIEHLSQSVNFTPFETRWVPSSARFIVAGCYPKGTGTVKIYGLDAGKTTLISESDKKEGIKCATFGASLYENRHLATGDYGGGLNLWDLEKMNTPVFNVKAHKSIVNCIDGCGGLNIGGGAPELVTGSRDGCVKVWDPRTSEPVASLEPASGQSTRDCWSVCFGNSHSDQDRCVAAGYDNGDIKLLDLRMNKLRWEANIKNGIVGLSFDRKDIKMNKLVVTSLESSFRVFDMRTQASDGFASMVEKQGDKKKKATVWIASHTPQNRDLFMTCSGNGTLSMYKYNYPSQRTVKDSETQETKGVPGTVTQLNSRRLSDQPIVSFDWHPEKQGLCVMTALDQTVKVGIVTKLNTQ